jgi:transposase
MVLVDGQGLPLGVRLESASSSEVKLAEATLAEVQVPRSKGRPRQESYGIIAAGGYDSDPLRQRLQKGGIELIAPYRTNNKKRSYEDGRKLRHYNRRWIVERTNAWLG